MQRCCSASRGLYLTVVRSCWAPLRVWGHFDEAALSALRYPTLPMNESSNILGTLGRPPEFEEVSHPI